MHEDLQECQQVMLMRRYAYLEPLSLDPQRSESLSGEDWKFIIAAEKLNDA